MESGFGMCGTFVAHPGKRDELEEQLLRGFDEPRMPGCQLYVVSRSLEDDDTLCVMELWTDAEAHRASLELAWVKESIAVAMPLIASMQGTSFTPVAGLLPEHA